MIRRRFLQLAAASNTGKQPEYRIVSAYKPAKSAMPGAYPATVVKTHSEKSIDAVTGRANPAVVDEMLSRGLCALTGETRVRDAWLRFVSPDDVIGLKVNCSGAPNIMSHPAVVSSIVRGLIDAGVPAQQVWIYERFAEQMERVRYLEHVPAGVHEWAAENQRGSGVHYDPDTYVEVSFFGEDDTRSNLVRLVPKLTKIINVPNTKEHQASGVTGCLKNIAYGNFSNVHRSHRSEHTHTHSFIGTLASVEPVRSRTVLHIMDGLRGVWHAGPFSTDPRFRFYPKQIWCGTDPVAMDRLLIDLIEEKRRAEGAPSIWDRSPEKIKVLRQPDPQFNRFVREPGHIEYAGKLGLGMYDKARIRVEDLAV